MSQDAEAAAGKIGGQCLCGAVAFEIDNDFRFLFYCYCEQCRRLSGSAHIANLSSETNSLVWLRGQNLVKRFDLPGRNFSKAFCQTCASPLPYMSNETGRIIVHAGCLEGEPVAKANARIFTHEAPHWAEPQILARLPGYRGYPPDY